MLDWFSSITNLFKKEPDKGSSLYLKEREDQKMWLFVGLGNPGKEYEKNRHNVGFMTLDTISKQNSGVFPDDRTKFQGLLSEGRIGTQKVLLLKPQTYMNDSGQSVARVAKFYKIDTAQILVFHDELDIAPGDVRIKQGGGNAGHNGLKSIQSHLGSADFWRVRIGIGRPAYKGQVTNYVLGDFSKAEKETLKLVLTFMGESISEIIKENPKAYERKIKEFIKIRNEQV